MNAPEFPKWVVPGALAVVNPQKQSIKSQKSRGLFFSNKPILIIAVYQQWNPCESEQQHVLDVFTDGRFDQIFFAHINAKNFHNWMVPW